MYYVMHIHKECLAVCDDKKDLIRYFANYNVDFGCTRQKITNSLLDDIAMNPNDIRSYPSWGYHKIAEIPFVIYHHEPRSIYVLDEYSRVIDPRIYKTEILDYEPPKYSYRHCKIRAWMPNNKLKFRFDPVRHTGNRRGKHCSSGSCLIQERRINCDEMHAPYVKRNARIKQSDSYWWDRKYRHCDKSWKTSYKVRKQYMKHM